MKRRAAILTFLSCVAAVACRPVETGVPQAEPEAGAAHAFPVLDVDAEDVVSVRLDIPGETVHVQRLPAGTWSVVESEEPAAATALQAVEGDVFPMLAYRRFVPTEPDDYGFSKESLTLSVQDRAGRSHRVSLGATSFSRAGFYARSTDSPDAVYLVPTGVYVALVSLTSQGFQLAEPYLATFEQLASRGNRDDSDTAANNPWLDQARTHRDVVERSQ